MNTHIWSKSYIFRVSKFTSPKKNHKTSKFPQKLPNQKKKPNDNYQSLSSSPHSEPTPNHIRSCGCCWCCYVESRLFHFGCSTRRATIIVLARASFIASGAYGMDVVRWMIVDGHTIFVYCIASPPHILQVKFLWPSRSQSRRGDRVWASGNEAGRRRGGEEEGGRNAMSRRELCLGLWRKKVVDGWWSCSFVRSLSFWRYSHSPRIQCEIICTSFTTRRWNSNYASYKNNKYSLVKVVLTALH